MSGTLRDIVHAWRGLRRKPGFLVATVLTIAIGIGTNVTMFSLVNGLALRPMPFGDRTERLVTLHSTHAVFGKEPGWGDSEISYRDLLDYRSATSVESIEAYLTRNFVLSGGEASPERVQGGSVTPNLFPLLGIQPYLGRHFLPEEATPPGLEPVVMLTDGLWRRRYGADPAIIGKSIVVNDRARTVIGVLPRGFRFPERDDLYMPLRGDEASRNARNVNAVALLNPGVTIRQAGDELTAMAGRLAAVYPETNRGFGVRVVPIRQTYIGASLETTAAIMMAAVGFVLLIMCANLANLMLVRGASRQRELAVRGALGASRFSLAWLALAESLLLAVPGALLGLLGSRWAIDWMVSSFPEEIPYWLDFGIDANVTSFTMAAACFTTVTVGLLPSIRATRPDVVGGLKETGGAVSLGPAGHRLQSVLAIVQVALCFGLLVGADLMVRSFLAMRGADLGFDHRPILSARGYLAGDAYDSLEARSAFYRRVAQAAAAIPGVADAAVTTSIPGDDGGTERALVTDGRTEEGQEIGIQSVAISPELFRTLDLPLLAGRTFTSDEANDPDADVALLNQSLANRLWPGSSALDRRVGFKSAQSVRWLRVVGVVPDVHYEEIGEDTEQSRLNVYVPYAFEGPRSMAILMRAHGNPDAVMGAARDALQRLGPTFPVYRLMPMRELRRFTTWEEGFFGNLMAVFAAMALLLACLGVHALISYSVGRRRREIGIRVALGASPGAVVGMLLREAVTVGAAGLLAGLTLALAIARTLVGALYGVTVNAWVFASMAIPLGVALVLATWWPARRASRVDPTVALRTE